jgi:hypothetical protein
MTGLKLSLHPWTEPFDTSVKHLATQVIDPNFTVVRELKEVEKALKKEMEKLADDTGALETWPHEAILELHSLADRFDGDEYIHRLLVAMCFDLSRHLDVVPQLIKDVGRKINFLFYYHSRHDFDYYSFNLPCTGLHYFNKYIVVLFFVILCSIILKYKRPAGGATPSSEAESYSRGARTSSEPEVRPRGVQPLSKAEGRSRVASALV